MGGAASHGRGAGRPDPATAVHPIPSNRLRSALRFAPSIPYHRIGSEVHSDLHLPGPIPSRIGPLARCTRAAPCSVLASWHCTRRSRAPPRACSPPPRSRSPSSPATCDRTPAGFSGSCYAQPPDKSNMSVCPRKPASSTVTSRLDSSSLIVGDGAVLSAKASVGAAWARRRGYAVTTHARDLLERGAGLVKSDVAAGRALPLHTDGHRSAVVGTRAF